MSHTRDLKASDSSGVGSQRRFRASVESDDEILTSLDMLIEAGRPRPEAFPSEKPQLDYFGMDLIRRSDY